MASQQFVSRLRNQIIELTVDYEEHNRVIETMNDLDPERRAYQFINGILIQKDVKTAAAIVDKRRSIIKTRLGELQKVMEAKIKELSRLRREFVETQEKLKKSQGK
ncbi:putative multi-domain containing protein [Aduncisulcus paluster]|uniref:Multi-domain containing protein n=1 Tax=Aduncisulcus paluster TaxID=2918883 RepID=A0ABQ5JQW8_9EUKA|nr:putative multi-domain containing protein [Aduncisulcus paluster]